MDPYAEQDQPAAPPRPRRGCLWGCLGTMVAAVVVIVAVFSFGAHHFFGKLNDDAQVQTIMAALNRSDEATSVLGRNITPLNKESHTYSYATGRGGTASYVLNVAGSNGQGVVEAELDVTGPTAKIKTLVLIDAEGHPHTIVGTPPTNPLMQNSI